MEIRRNPTTGKIIPRRFTIEQIEEADSDMGGFCVACGAEAYGVEPDARAYRCDVCENRTVYGAAEIALRGWVKQEAAE